MKSSFLLLLPGLCILAGCLQPESSSNLSRVSGNPFGFQPPSTKVARPNLPAANSEIAARVDFVGKKILAANPKAGFAPVFATIGSPSVEIFHIDFTQVCVTEGLVKKCKGEEELAAILAQELGRMAIEKATRQAYANPDRPLAAMTVGNDKTFDGFDPTTWAQIGKQENDRNRLSRPNPQQSARTFLEKAGYPGSSLDGVQPLLREADRNCALERQFKGLPPQ